MVFGRYVKRIVTSYNTAYKIGNNLKKDLSEGVIVEWVR